eukprot:gb/GFBE01068729.1/.p1 GENE.gb/GFBE01068729.1/~~gb/GFBE01068729.1/.p1  ORF type:complete len:526 (+),score=124.15 gb/GFBE01068729.1/:1-1578(+)
MWADGRPSWGWPEEAKQPEPAPSKLQMSVADSQHRDFVVVNFTNVGIRFGKTFLQDRGRPGSAPQFHWEGVRRCVRYLTERRGLRVIGVAFENWRGLDGEVSLLASTVSGVPDDIRAKCATVQEVPRLCGEHQRSADDEITIKCAYHRNCFFLDNDNYKDWKEVMPDPVVRAWLNARPELHLRYYFDSGLGMFELIDGLELQTSARVELLPQRCSAQMQAEGSGGWGGQEVCRGNAGERNEAEPISVPEVRAPPPQASLQRYAVETFMPGPGQTLAFNQRQEVAMAMNCQQQRQQQQQQDLAMKQSSKVRVLEKDSLQTSHALQVELVAATANAFQDADGSFAPASGSFAPASGSQSRSREGAAADISPQTPARAAADISPQTPARNKRKAQAGFDVSAMPPKQALNVFMGRVLGREVKKGEDIQYFKLADGSAEVRLISMGTSFRGKPHASYKEAEKLAAVAALAHYQDMTATLPPAMRDLKRRARPQAHVRRELRIGCEQVARKAREAAASAWYEFAEMHSSS